MKDLSINPVSLRNAMRIKNIICLLAAAFLLASCANMQPGGGSQSTSLENSGETTIFLQAVGIGAGVGLGVGLLACDKLDGLAKKLCIASTTTVGGGIGYYVAQQQIKNLKQVRLQNDQLSTLVNEARRYNNETASYNSRLKQEIRQLRQSRGQDPRYVAGKLNAARNKRNKVTEAINVRRAMVAKLSDHSQRSRYQQTLRKLESESSLLDYSIRELEQIGGPAVIGA